MKYTLSLLSLAMLAACGTTTSDRTLSGAAIGAGVGALGSAATGGDAGTGALVGGALGAAAGATTKEKDLDLGKPIWRK
jgi:osmotically inducible lipoprotein OsmB